MTANDQCTWRVKRTRKLDKRYDLRMALCLFESVVRGHRIYKEVWTPRTAGEELLVEIVNIVSLKFASDEAAG